MRTMQKLLQKRAMQSPNLEALVGGEKRYSFQQYNERVNQLAHYLLHNGVQRGDRIGILCKNNHPFPSVMMASLKIGAVCIPLNHQLTAYELETIVKEAKLKVLVIDEEFSEVLLKIDAVKEIPYVIQTTKEGFGSFELELQKQPTSEPNVEVHEEDDAIYLFTSGTTGQAKACVIGHKNLHHYFAEIAGQREIPAGERFLSVHPLFHMSGVLSILNCIYHGVTMIFLADSNPAIIWDKIEEEKITTMLAFPAVYSYMLDELNKKERNISTFKVAQSGGTKVPETLIQKYMEKGIYMVQGYGSTEGWVVTSWHPMMGKEKMSSVGKTLKHVEVKIVHPETGDELTTNEVGEIHVRSPYMFKGYWNNEKATKKVVKDNWFNMGDAGMIDDDGFLHIMGRYKDVIIRGGDNVYPDQVEDVIHEIHGVLEVAVVGVPDDFWGEVPRAYIVKDGETTLTEESITQYCKEKLASYKIPEVVFIEELPKNALGKVLKRELRDVVLMK
ncbi:MULTISPECIES: class I adenylate-forming enzyme family protein [Bacillus]|uniref:Acyl--CoA ligase n=2 Tax=Bacillus cereus group TaxID=86661 RepID=A0ABD7DMB3_BACCE|nr:MULTISPECIES: class I adenylate-forming enzyme family protein [Bacillus cereus group]KAA6478255.1 long-chain fatty acid--CoA ligase [Bacillus cereus]KAB2395692.1 acyl--CoA ligase [Bacillus cereus]KAB2476979.1 acyl--CoA ligase [Bacillus cereus]MBV6678082.1 acyl--CoA ligase [Bacillus thuringiensis]MDR4148399.1 acyl--CoA ligase [Bacillus thuringiensis]